MRKSVLFLATCALSSSLLVSSCKENKKTSKPIKVEFKKEGERTLLKPSNDSIYSKFEIEISEDEYETQRGLMDRYEMANNRGMLFIFPNVQPRSFYMKNTYIPLDIIYIDEDKSIVSIQKNAKPLDESSLPSGLPAKYVLEINAGLTQQLNIEVGDKIEFTRTDK